MNIKHKIDFSTEQALNKKLNKSSDSFSKVFDVALSSTKSDSDIGKKIDEFKDNLVKDGAYSYILNINNNKISNKLKNKKSELQEILGLYDQSLSDSQQQKLNSLLNGFLNNYEKKLQQNKSFNNLIEQKQKDYQKQNNFLTLENLLKDIQI